MKTYITTYLPCSQSDGHLVNLWFHSRPGMATNKTRAEIEAEIEELHRLHVESNRQATFGGWTREAEDEHHKRADRISALYGQLAALRSKDS